MGVDTKSKGLALPAVSISPGHFDDFLVTGTVPTRAASGAYDLTAFVTTRSAVPELSAWAMRLVGFRLVGLPVRRKVRSAIATA